VNPESSSRETSAKSSHPVIQVLPDNIINKIAAGEVVDRPASVVKELIENALDAGARHVVVSIVDGGLKLLSVSDDGCGMDRDNALLSVERHATSKIRHVNDIESVATLGFRGEALAAIASVSRFTLATRRAEDLNGTEIRINGGKIEDVCETGCPPGTQISVRNLFFNVPARRKFLKTASTELNYIRQVFMLYAMGRPDAGLRLVVDEKEIYQLDGDSQLEDRIRQMYGSEIVHDLHPVDGSAYDMRVHGLVSGPRLHRGDRSEQYLFINGRPASAPVLGFAINEAYQDMLPRGRHPLIFLFIDLPVGEVDVNVHPTKKEVRFRQSSRVRDAVIAAIKNALLPAVSSKAQQLAESQGTIHSSSLESILKVQDLPELPAFDYPRRKDDVQAGLTSKGDRKLSGPADAANVQAVSSSVKPPWHWCRILGQIANYYVVLETDEGMILMDPQSAHERVLYDQMMADARKNKLKTQGLLVPETISLPPVKAGLIKKHMNSLKELGFGISEFGGDTLLLDALPSALGPLSGSALFLDIADQLESLGKSGLSSAVLRENIIKAATWAAVRTTTQLTREELERLINDLSLTELPYTSPRGRPTLIFTSLQELKKKFGR